MIITLFHNYCVFYYTDHRWLFPEKWPVYIIALLWELLVHISQWSSSLPLSDGHLFGIRIHQEMTHISGWDWCVFRVLSLCFRLLLHGSSLTIPRKMISIYHHFIVRTSRSYFTIKFFTTSFRWAHCLESEYTMRWTTFSAETVVYLEYCHSAFNFRCITPHQQILLGTFPAKNKGLASNKDPPT